MGLIKTAFSAVSGTLGDQWLEAIEPYNMTSETILTVGVKANQGDKHNQNKKGSAGVITDGSVIRVGENQMMMLVDGGKIIDYSAEPGYYTVNNQNAPSLLNGDFGGALSDAFNRFKFGGTTPYAQQVIFVNTAEIPNVPFGTANAINYFDEFYNAELSIRAHGYYSIRIINPIKFYTDAASKNTAYVGIEELKKMYLSEFLTAFQTTIGKMSVAGDRISHLTSKTTELADYMGDVLDESWEQRRGMKVEKVAISSVSYDEQSKKLIDIRNQGAMLGDPNVRTGYVQGAAARGIEAAGSNSGGGMAGFMGVNMGMGAGADLISASGAVNQQQAQAQQAQQAAPTAAANLSESWICPNCKHQNAGGKFCSECGTTKPGSSHCSNCGKEVLEGQKFCTNCGQKQ